MGIGTGEGEHRAVEAATNAISSPLLEDVSIQGATGIIINISGASNLSIHEVNEATTLIMEAAHEDAEIIFGTVIDESLKDSVKVTVIATGLNSVLQSMHSHAAVTTVQVPAQAPVAAAIATVASAPVAAPIAAPVTPVFNTATTAAPMMSKPPVVDAQPVVPPAPKPEMLAQAAAMVKGHQPMPAAGASAHEFEEQPVAAVAQAAATENSELARARAIAQRLGITNLTDDEYDVPAYLRRQQADREL
jgi:cell division protein FtsZ